MTATAGPDAAGSGMGVPEPRMTTLVELAAISGDTARQRTAQRNRTWAEVYQGNGVQCRGLQASATAVHDGVDPGRWKSLAVILGAAFVVALDFFIVNVSIPSIRANLHATFAEVQLII